MLNPRFVILIIALHLTSSLKKDTKLDKKQLLRKPINCEKIKCPPIEQPICTKLVYKNSGSKVIYVVMVNKCEMNYVKCHEGLEAHIVPMKNCDHDALLKTKKRSKRQVAHDVDPDELVKDHMILELNASKATMHKTLQGLGQTNNEEFPEQEVKEPTVVPEAQGEGSQIVVEPQNEETPKETLTNSNERNVEQEVGNGDGNTQNQQLQDGELDESKSAILIIKERDMETTEGTSFRPDYGPDEVDLAQYQAECPTVCPSRDIMVCAQCKHGIYRTFLSICHMRMFRCSHTDETLELVSRYPCMMSAPYLPDDKMQPRGRVQEPNDHDKVLRFIACREKTQTSREDPRCMFKREEDTRLMLEADNVDDNY